MIDLSLLLAAMLAQNLDQRGFIENQSLLYPQAAPNDSGRVVNATLLRWEAAYTITQWLKVSGALDARTDSHRQVERKFRLDADDRSVQRPAFSLRRISATLHKGSFTAEIGRQFIRWGKADILNPTDRFAPRDYLSSVVDSDFLGVSAARLTYEWRGDTIDLVWQPWFTPSRTPLINQRWTVVPPQAQGVTIADLGARYPGGSQYGARWNHIGAGYEYSLCFFDGFNNLPLFSLTFDPAKLAAGVQRYYPTLRLYGADAAVPLRWLTVKGEAAYFTSSTPDTDEYVLYVIQLERQVKEWSFVGGYAGEAVTHTAGNPLRFAPDRGYARSFVGRAGLTIDANRSLALEAAVRAAGSFVRVEYSQAFGQHWRATAALAWIRGDMTDFLGQYRRNSYASLAFRYSF
ncbi:MAG: hypothetical protein DMG59_22595 [Acidobacteria bacterium]|nr:MAG: hypothetical protein DMG59_22595 [Acidobacteriota bacterium]